MNLAPIGRFLRSMVNSYRFFTPHYWRMQAHRDDVGHAMQALLPAPYDPYAIELRSRAMEHDHPAIPDTGSSEDDSWKPVMEKLSAKALDRRLATIGAVEISAWAVEDVHSAFASIDHDVIAGIELRTHGTIDSFSDLGHALAPDTILARLSAALPWHHVNSSAPALRSLVGSSMARCRDARSEASIDLPPAYSTEAR